MTRLHDLAQHYWNKPETANCTIVIPVPRRPRPPKLTDVDPALRMTFRLHREYLCAKSLFLRALFSGASPPDLLKIPRTPDLAPLRIPPSRLPRLLPSPSSHPVVFLPVPDPSSIQPLLHWMYFGTTDHIQHALDRGNVRWEGLVHNVEYLGLSTDIKVFLGHWYRVWHLPARCSPGCSPCPTDDGDDDSDCDSDCSDSDEYYSPTTPPEDDDDEEMQCNEECDRGRARNVKPLARLYGRLRVCSP